MTKQIRDLEAKLDHLDKVDDQLLLDMQALHAQGFTNESPEGKTLWANVYANWDSIRETRGSVSSVKTQIKIAKHFGNVIDDNFYVVLK